MRVLVTGCCGFVGSSLLESLARLSAGGGSRVELYGVDNLSRPGSEQNRRKVGRIARFCHADMRCASDVDSLPEVDFVIDAAANPSVIAGVQGSASSRQTVEHNLASAINILEFCRRSKAGFWLLSTSRVYSIKALCSLPLTPLQNGFRLDTDAPLPSYVSPEGVTESFPTQSPISLCGSTKLAAELLALEYAAAFDFPICINRCGVLAGPGQFGRPEQGIVAFWINSWLRRRPLTYIGFNGSGHQVRDCLHIRDLGALIWRQFERPPSAEAPIVNVGRGSGSWFSLAQLSAWCAERFGEQAVVKSLIERQFDVPWLIMDSRLAKQQWNWQPEVNLQQIWTEVAIHADENPNWLELSGGA